MKTFKKLAAVTALAAVMAPAMAADVITLDFEGVGDLAAINEFYNGGTDSQGNSGTNYNVSFAPGGALGVIDSDKGGSFNGNAFSGKTAMIFLDNAAILNYSAGFDTGFSFRYATPNTAGSVSVYSGLNLSGALLGTIELPINGPGGGPGGIYSNWSIGALGFAGTAKSIDFGGTANYIAYDDVTFGSITPGIPEPSTYALMALGLAAVGFLARRRKAA
jgi:hypothetical protein